MPHSTSASIDVRSSREDVWRALTQPELVKRYFFGTNLVTDWKVGQPLFFRGEWEGKPYEDRGTVLSFEPLRGFSFNYYSAFSGREDVLEERQIIEYELGDCPGGVRVTIRQSNVDSEERAEHSRENWMKVLSAMKALVENTSQNGDGLA